MIKAKTTKPTTVFIPSNVDDTKVVDIIKKQNINVPMKNIRIQRFDPNASELNKLLHGQCSTSLQVDQLPVVREIIEKSSDHVKVEPEDDSEIFTDAFSEERISAQDGINLNFSPSFVLDTRKLPGDFNEVLLKASPDKEQTFYNADDLGSGKGLPFSGDFIFIIFEPCLYNLLQSFHESNAKQRL